jgi:hypothetical protein
LLSASPDAILVLAPARDELAGVGQIDDALHGRPERLPQAHLFDPTADIWKR